MLERRRVRRAHRFLRNATKNAKNLKIESEPYPYDGFFHRLRLIDAGKCEINITELTESFNGSTVLLRHESAAECVLEVRFVRRCYTKEPFIESYLVCAGVFTSYRRVARRRERVARYRGRRVLRGRVRDALRERWSRVELRQSNITKILAQKILGSRRASTAAAPPRRGISAPPAIPLATRA